MENRENNNRDQWVSKLGLVLAMAGNAVGLGNFIRFPMQAAKNGGGAFMIPYLVCFLLLGLPLMFVEWGMGRYGGSKGHATMPGILALIKNNKFFRILGSFAVWIPLVIASYYCFIESWAMGYSFFSFGNAIGTSPAEAGTFFDNYIGLKNSSTLIFYFVTICVNGFILYKGISQGIEKVAKILMPLLFVLAIILVVRVVIIGVPDAAYPERSVNNGFGFVWNPKSAATPELETKDLKDPIGFAKKLQAHETPLAAYIFENLSPGTMKLLVEYNPGSDKEKNPCPLALQAGMAGDVNILLNSKDFYNADRFKEVKLSDDLKKKVENPADDKSIVVNNRALLNAAFPDDIGKFFQLGIFSIWLAAAGQIFFTLSLGMGAIACYASYVDKKDDVVASGLATALTNETTEVVLGGSIAIPLAVAFFGLAAAKEIAASSGLGFAFVTMPTMFGKIPLGNIFGGIWFLLLFFAGITSSIAMGQIVVAFFNEIVGMSKKASVIITMVVIFILSLLAVFGITKGSMDEMDQLAGTIALPVFSLIAVIAWVHIYGVEKSWKELMQGSKIKLWEGIKFITAYISPLFLIIIIGGWVVNDGKAWLMMENVDPANKTWVLATRIVLFVVFAVLAGLSTMNMHKTADGERGGE